MESAQQTRDERAKQIELLKIKRALNDAELATLYKRFLPSLEKSPESSTTVAPEAITNQHKLNDAQVAILAQWVLATMKTSPKASTTVVPEASKKAESKLKVPNANAVTNDADNAKLPITVQLNNEDLVSISDGAANRLVSAVGSNKPTMDFERWFQYMDGYIMSGVIMGLLYFLYLYLQRTLTDPNISTDPNQALVHTIGPQGIYHNLGASQSGSVVNAVFANSERTKTRVVRKGVAHRGE
jgi:hypothetical protein